MAADRRVVDNMAAADHKAARAVLRAQDPMAIVRKADLDRAAGTIPAADLAVASTRIRMMMIVRTTALVHRAANLRRPEQQYPAS